ncbi:hypothetical protein ScPMuIL_005311 [Solemya velum]
MSDIHVEIKTSPTSTDTAGWSMNNDFKFNPEKTEQLTVTPAARRHSIFAPNETDLFSPMNMPTSSESVSSVGSEEMTKREKMEMYFRNYCCCLLVCFRAAFGFCNRPE